MSVSVLPCVRIFMQKFVIKKINQNHVFSQVQWAQPGAEV